MLWHLFKRNWFRLLFWKKRSLSWYVSPSNTCMWIWLKLPLSFCSLNLLQSFANCKTILLFYLILVSLKCSMDIQSSDGWSLLLKYVSNYVSKMKDHQVFKGLSLHKTSFIWHNFYIIDHKIVTDSFTHNSLHWISAWLFPFYNNLITIIMHYFTLNVY